MPVFVVPPASPKLDRYGDFGERQMSLSMKTFSCTAVEQKRAMRTTSRTASSLAWLLAVDAGYYESFPLIRLRPMAGAIAGTFFRLKAR